MNYPYAAIALRQYQDRQRRAQEIVRSRGMSVGQATQHLRPWLAIACLCGADHPDIAATIADVVHQAQSAGLTISPCIARYLAAEELCPRTRWVPVLANARNAAFDAFLANDSEPTLTAARALQCLALALQYDPNGPPIPLYQPPAERTRAA